MARGRGEGVEGAALWLRPRGPDAERSAPIELFLDLVYVFAVTQLSHLLLEHLTVRGALQTLLLLLAVWWAWVYTSWITNYFDPNALALRLLLIGLMLTSLIMSAAIPEAFGDRGLMFAAAYVAIQIGRTAFVVIGLGRDHHLARTIRIALTLWTATAVPWLVGGSVHGSAREAFWTTAIVLELVLPFAMLAFSGVDTRQWTLVGAHLAERCQLFLILALGESIIVTGSTVADAHLTGAVVTAFVTAFLCSVALWWIYFDRSADYGSGMITASDDPGRLALVAYTYFHVLIVAGIIVTAVADELTIADPGADGTDSYAAVVLGGPALFLAGFTLYLWAIAGYVKRIPLLAIGGLALLVPVGLSAPRLATAICTTSVVLAVAAWATVVGRNRVPA
jgi:low temperature requirement protein LtrA